MIATAVPIPSPLAFLGEFMLPEGAATPMPTDFAALLGRLNVVPETSDSAVAEVPDVEAEATDEDDDSGPVPKGLEAVADTLAAALAAVLAAAGKPAETGLSHRLGITTGKGTPATPAASALLATVGTPAEAKFAQRAASADTPVSDAAPASPEEALATLLAAAGKPAETGLSHRLGLATKPDATLAPAIVADTDAQASPEPAKAEQPSAAGNRLVDLALPTTPLAAPQPVASSPAASIDAPSAQPISSSEIVMTRHLDLAKDSAWLDNLARDIVRTASHDAQLRFQLNPEHLGSLRVELANTADGTAIRLSADTEAARNILVDAQPRLVAEARAQGLRISESQVDLGNHGGQQRSHQENPQPAVRIVRPAEERAARPRQSAERYA
jgi:flagellar hook-length control protein FliK